jgi:hypothetical protein
MRTTPVSGSPVYPTVPTVLSAPPLHFADPAVSNQVRLFASNVSWVALKGE